MKIAIIHHNADMDGLTSGTLATKTFQLLKSNFPELDFDYEIIGYNYGKNPEEDLWLDINKSIYHYYQFIDITPPIEWLKMVQPLIETNKIRIEIFDHHTPVYNEIQKLEINSENFYYFDENYSGAYIYFVNLLIKNSWHYSFIFDLFGAISFIDKFSVKKRYNNFISLLKEIIDTPQLFDIVKLVDSYDTWKWKKNEEKQNYDALALNEYFLQYNKVENYSEILFNKNIDISLMLTYGWQMIKLNSRFASERKHLFFNYKNENFVIINTKANVYDIDIITGKKIQALNQELNQVLNPEYEKYSNIDAILFYNNIDFLSDKINFSVRQINKDFDCNSFIKELTNGNGGGHSAASGGQMNITDFLKLTTKNY